jgi:hypothetical protein
MSISQSNATPSTGNATPSTGNATPSTGNATPSTGNATPPRNAAGDKRPLGDLEARNLIKCSVCFVPWSDHPTDTICNRHRPQTGGERVVDANTHETMPTPPANLERELAFFRRMLPELLTLYSGRWAVVKGETGVLVYPTYDLALKAGYRYFGLGGFLIKQILEHEPIITGSVAAYLERDHWKAEAERLKAESRPRVPTDPDGDPDGLPTPADVELRRELAILRESRDAATAENERLKAENESLAKIHKKNLESADRLRDVLRDKVDESASLRTENRGLLGQLVEAREDLAMAMSTLDEAMMRPTHGAPDPGQDAGRDADQEIARLKAELDAVRRDARMDLAGLMAEAERLRAEAESSSSRDSLMESILKLTRENETLRAESRRFYRADGTYKLLDSPHEVIQRRIAAAGDINHLKAENEALKAENAALSSSRDMARRRLDAAQVEVKASHERIEELVSVVNRQVDEIERLTAERDAAWAAEVGSDGKDRLARKRRANG